MAGGADVVVLGRIADAAARHSVKGTGSTNW
jgi:hypothetical protein